MKAFRRSLSLWAAALFAFALFMAPASAAYLPSIRIGTAGLISPAAANTYYGAGTTSTDKLSSYTGVETPTPPEIVQLAIALKQDPDLIFQYVNNNIQTVWMYGLQKGALGAEIDKSGTPFDQAELTVALLRQAGYTPSYVAGTISLNATQFFNWTGITSAYAACQLLSSGGIPATINGTINLGCSSANYPGTVSTVQMAHVWVQVTIAGSHAAGCSASDVCVFDPSYKTYSWRAGINLASATGMASSTPLAQATSTMGSGTTSGVPYVDTLNATALNSTLQSASASLLSYIQANHLQGKQMQDIVSGGIIVPVNTTVRQTALPYADPSPPYSAHVWTPSTTDAARYNAIPDKYRVLFGVNGQMEKFDGSGYDTMFNVTFYADEVYGRALTVQTDFNTAGITSIGSYAHNTVTLQFDNLPLANVPAYTITSPSGATPRGLPSNITLTVDHPYAAAANGTPSTTGDYMDALTTLGNAITKNVVLITPLTIVASFGDASATLFNKLSDERSSDTVLPRAQNAPRCPGNPTEICPPTYTQPTGDFQREKAASLWLAQNTSAANLHAAIANAIQQTHHVLGFVYSDTQLTGAANDPSKPTELDYAEGDAFDRIDVDQGISLTNKAADATKRRAGLLAFAASSAALEGSMGAQMSDLPDTASTASRFAWANSPPVDAKQNPNALGPIKFYQFTSGNISAAPSIPTFEGSTSGPASVTLHWADQPAYSDNQIQLWRQLLSNTIQDYGAQFTVVAPQDSFIGPGQRGGEIEVLTRSGTTPLTYTFEFPKQRGPALVATKYDANGNPLEIAHLVEGYSPSIDGLVETKGGGSGNEPDRQTAYSPADAADILKSRFVDRSNALGVNLANGTLAYSSPASLRMGSGGAPYELSAGMIWHPGPPLHNFAPTADSEPQPGWTTSWNNRLSISGSGLEAMGQSDIRAAAGAIVSFLAAQDIYASSQAPERDVAGVLTQSWWANQLSDNVATASVGGGSQQFLRLPDRTFIAPGTGFAKLAQTSTRVPYEYVCADLPDPPPYQLTRGWDASTVGFNLTNAHGDVQHFAYWKDQYTTDLGGNQCGQLKGFRLASWTYPQGPSLTLSYAPFNNIDHISQIATSLGRQIVMQYSSGTFTGFTNGLSGSDARSVAITANVDGSTSHTDPNSATSRFVYQAAQTQSATLRPVPYVQLNQVFLANNTTQANSRYYYDPLGRIAAITDAVANQSGGRAPYYFYIADGTRGERDDPLSQPYTVVYDTFGHPSRYIDEMLRETDALFDSRGRPSYYYYQEHDCDVFDYDDHNNTTDFWRVDTASACNTAAGAAHVLHASAVWDQTWNKPIVVTDARGNASSLAYYASGNGASLLQRVQRPTIAEGVPVYTFTYDANGKPLTQVTPFVTAASVTTQNTYDPTTEDLLTTTLDPADVAATTAFAYDAQGDVITTTDPRGYVTTSLYDNDRRKTEDHHHNGNAAAALNAAERTVYDIIGRGTEEDAGTAFSGTTVTTWLKMQGKTYTPTSLVATATDADNRTVTNTYDNADRLFTVADPVGRVTRTVYCDLTYPDCAANQVAAEIRAYQGSGTACSVAGTLQSCSRRNYYALDGEVEAVEDANNNDTLYAYDPFIRLNKTTFADGSFEALTLDENGNVTQRVNRAGDTLGYTYNTLNWLTQKVSPRPSLTTNWSWLLNGAPASLSDSAGSTTSYGYDTAARQSSEVNTIPGLSGARTTSYVLDDSGNRTKLTWPDGYYVNYTYDNLNRMATAADSALTLATYAYDPLSRRTNLSYGSGAAMGYTYTSAGDLLTLSHTILGTPNNPKLTYTYTNAHQLASETSSTSSYLWQAPAAASLAYAPNQLNQYASVSGVGHAYDGNGNLLSDGVSAYTYDAENRMLSTEASGLYDTYSYDPLGRRTVKTTGTGAGAGTALWGAVNWGAFNWSAPVAGPPTYYVSSGTDEIAEYDASGNLITRYVPGPAIDEPIAVVTAAGAKTYFHTNRQGSVIAISNASGVLVEGPYTYSPYGNCYLGATTTPCSTSGEPYRFTGRRLDAETGLYYYRARYYGPSDNNGGRFPQTDPVGYLADVNLYTYVGNDPTDKSDPLGRDAVGAGIGAEIGGAIGAVACAPAAESCVPVFIAGGTIIGQILTNDAPKIVPQAPGSRSGKPFTPKGKEAVKEGNKEAHGGKQTCENCGRETTPAQQGQRGVTPQGDETHVDHVEPKSKGGSGTPGNGQVLCRDCNLGKSDKSPEQPQQQNQNPACVIDQKGTCR